MANIHNNLSELFTDIADAIRSKTGSTGPIVADEFPTAIEAIEVGTTEGIWEKMQKGTLTEYVDETATKIIGTFAGCANLKSVHLPSLNATNREMFSNCSSLKSAVLGKIYTIAIGAFRSCESLESLIADNLTVISDESFFECKSLTTASFPLVTSVGKHAFNNCEALSTVSLPVCTTIGDYAFTHCDALEEIVFPRVTQVGMGAFYSCPNLKKVDLHMCQKIGNTAFSSCGALKTLILRNTAVTPMGNINVLSNSAIASGEGYIYVPANLVDSYKVASRWETYASQIRALEDYTVDGTTTGELDESKI